MTALGRVESTAVRISMSGIAAEQPLSTAKQQTVPDPLQPFAREETGRWRAASMGGKAFSAFPHGITHLLGVAEIREREA